VYDEERFLKKKLVESKINRIEIVPNARYILVMTDYDITSFRIKKGVKTHDMEGHIDSILKIVVLEPQKMIRAAEEKIPDTPKIITCSLDNTILLWDFEKLEIITKMEAPEDSEISGMTFLYNCCLVATGHEDGAIRLWNLEISSSVLLKSDESKKHTNTIACIHGAIWKECEFLLCGDYDGKVSIWEISEKKGAGANSSGSTIFPQMRHMIDVNVKYKSRKSGNEMLVLNFWTQEKTGEGYILLGGNFNNIEVYNMRTY
jgi:WD40 repeat protein